MSARFPIEIEILENLKEPLTLSKGKNALKTKNKMAEMRWEGQTTVVAQENQTRVAKENRTGIVDGKS